VAPITSLVPTDEPKTRKRVAMYQKFTVGVPVLSRRPSLSKDKREVAKVRKGATIVDACGGN
jgi:hypothetical protein